MSEWWTYTLADFLLFSPRTYYRLFELYNAAIWPAQLAALAVALAILGLVFRRGGAIHGRIAAGLLAACWLWVAIAFHALRYETINWAAAYFAAAFAVEAALLVWSGCVRGALRPPPRLDAAACGGLAVLLFALLLQPALALLLGRPLMQLELFGVAPDPTAVATLGVVLLATDPIRWELLAVPVLWCAVGGATLWAMEAPDAWIMPLAAVLVLVMATRRIRQKRFARA